MKVVTPTDPSHPDTVDDKKLALEANWTIICQIEKNQRYLKFGIEFLKIWNWGFEILDGTDYCDQELQVSIVPQKFGILSSHWRFR